MAFWFWFFVAPAILLALWSLRGEQTRADYVAACLSATGPERLPPATVIVPVKGPEEGLRGNLASLAALDYPDYELLIVARSAADIPPGVLPSGAKVVVSCEGDPKTGEKIQNLLAGLHVARKHSEVFAFADSDGRVPRGWLRALVAPLAGEGIGAATGYRWYLPQPPDFWSLLRSVWNAAIAGTLGPGPAPFAWGGAMAIRKDLFFEMAVPDHWKHSVSDDYGLTAAVRAAGLRIAFAPGAMAATTDHTTARAFLGWAKRQMVITRIYHPKLWWTALAAHFFYCGGMAAGIAAAVMGSRGAEWALIALLSPGMLKGTNRATLAKAELPEFAAWFDRYGWAHTWWLPLATWVWLFTLLISAWTSVIEWRGNRYDLKQRAGAKPGSPAFRSGIQ